MEEDERTDDADRGPSENKRVAPTPLSRLRRTPAQGAVIAGSSASKYVCLVPRSPIVARRRRNSLTLDASACVEEMCRPRTFG